MRERFLRSTAVAASKKPSSLIPRHLEPMEARLVSELPRNEGWQYEPKWDGFRCLAIRDGTHLELQARSGKSLSRYFPEMLAAVAALERFFDAVSGAGKGPFVLTPYTRDLKQAQRWLERVEGPSMASWPSASMPLTCRVSGRC